MKYLNDIKIIFLFIFSFLGFFFLQDDVSAQNRTRLNADFVKIINGENYLNIKASSRVDRKTIEVAHIELEIVQILEEEETIIGKTVTDVGGLSKFIIKDFNNLQADSLGVYNLLIKFAGNDSFKKASRSISFKNADIKVEWIVKDSTNYVLAELRDSHLDSTLADMPLGVRVDRIFRPLKIGEDSYDTDENGKILVEIEEGIPGIDGRLDLEVVLNESDEFGTVIGKITAPIGTVIVDESSFDERTMWSPRGKTPLFLLGLTYTFIIVAWGIFIYLFINLFRIVKS